ncbi:hypothetical protein N781_01365 [Pontibacillus halophilus JSM 076056 = DSM 19796]|uniref:Sporulation protein n=1 Tax=Pontibacillus halophilus JSM 076056 = DSM 19796 TaxID=1385510 RepID=A0A0A5GQ49_9BACI|nr:hypothetical protein [Pontibacillus halophilus]KGX94074.1 hypothetical protein N781_01365 [Pontibacillus halophilus JSM 076056 = DSM 19796]
MRWLMMIFLIGTLGACGTTEEGSTNDVKDVQFFKRTANTLEKASDREPGYSESDNPMQVDQLGKTWGIGPDREKAREGAELVEGVDVKRISIRGSQAYVHVHVDGLTSQDEAMVYADKVRKSVQKALPRYTIKVRVN